MVTRPPRLIVVLLLVLGGSGFAETRPTAGAPQQSRPPQRIVSLVPSITETLFAIGAGKQVVAVSSYDEFPPEVKALPRVGALLDPNVERIVSLRPDLVITYGSQSTLEAQLGRAGIRSYSYRHGGIATTLDTIDELGRMTGHEGEARRIVAAVQQRLADVRTRVRGRPRPKTLLVFGRQPGTLREIYASGGTGFLHDMLEAAGGADVFGDMKRESVQPSTEMLIARGPEVVLEVAATRPAGSWAPDGERRAWAALASIPAVRSGRIYFLTGDYLVEPGPRLAQGVEAVARALHPDAFK